MSPRRVTVDTPALALRRAEAAAALGLSVDTFDAAVRPYVACVRIGSVVVYPTDELRRWLECNRAAPIADLDRKRVA